jgi:glycosyltransferase involved in cell wall biosynthesis
MIEFCVMAMPNPPAGIQQLSLVIPVYNEVANLRPLCAEIREALAGLPLDYEVILVDDGSTDGSFAEMQALHAADDHIRAIRFRRNFGQTAAFAAGFDFATRHGRDLAGRVIVTMDADRQNDPADIPALLARLDEGCDVVNGWRQDRQDPFLLRKVPSYFANQLIARSTKVGLRDRGCSLRAFRAEVVSEIHLYGEMHRFIPEMISFAGFSMAEVPVSHRPRVAGQSKYGLSRTFRVILDLITVLFLRRYSDRPMNLLGGVGILSTGTGLLIGAFLAGTKIWAGLTGGWDAFHATRIGDRPLLLLAVLLILLGAQFLVMGLLAELVVRTYYESQNKPVYHIREIIGPIEQIKYP